MVRDVTLSKPSCYLLRICPSLHLIGWIDDDDDALYDSRSNRSPSSSSSRPAPHPLGWTDVMMLCVSQSTPAFFRPSPPGWEDFGAGLSSPSPLAPPSFFPFT
eukprot:TRINITY_DN6446_c0_g1_i1.p1 TRINITY_DN6446_c0_g1~~TRINITY_DN6446_c0_g1_i1.p1  ORF type:complete len:103 (-),score=16.39 TRINITY_DN6446_c0_g1_i1:274-582(-)